MDTGYIFMGIAGFLLVFLILRGFNSWYWKIDDIIELLTEQNKLLSKLVEDNQSFDNDDDDDNLTKSHKKSFFEKLKDEEAFVKSKKK